MTHDDAPLQGPFHDWYETWRAQAVDRREAKANARWQHARDDVRVALLVGAFIVLGGVLGALAVALAIGN